MLLIETALRQITTALQADHLAIISASRSDRSDEENLERTKLLAAAARDAGFGFQVVEGRWTGSQSREWLLLVIADANRASHLLGLGRKWAEQFDQRFFIIGTPDDLAQIGADGNRKRIRLGSVRLEPSALIFPDARSFVFEREFRSSGWFTAMAHSRGCGSRRHCVETACSALRRTSGLE